MAFTLGTRPRFAALLGIISLTQLCACERETEAAQAFPIDCYMYFGSFCLGSATEDFDITIGRTPQSLHGSTYFVSGSELSNSEGSFLAVIRPIRDERMLSASEICQAFAKRIENCKPSSVKIAVLNYLTVPIESPDLQFQSGIVVYLIHSDGLQANWEWKLAFPCVETSDAQVKCGPKLGTCYLKLNGTGCDPLVVLREPSNVQSSKLAQRESSCGFAGCADARKCLRRSLTLTSWAEERRRQDHSERLACDLHV